MSTVSNAAVAGSSENTDFYLIGELACLAGVSCGAIRYYEREGLLAPTRHGRFRVYVLEDAERLKLIVELRDIGMPLKTIRDLIGRLPLTGNWRASELAKTVLHGHKDELIRRRAELTRQLGALAGMLGESATISD